MKVDALCMKGLLNGSKSFVTLSYVPWSTSDVGFHPILEVTIGKASV